MLARAVFLDIISPKFSMKRLSALTPILAGLCITAGASLIQADPVEFGFRFHWHPTGDKTKA
jgi:hypothetical protein